jgi:hypothetical protein
VLRLYREQNQRSTLAFFSAIREALPFPIRRLQCDNGTEFPLAFALTVQEAGTKLRYIEPRRPDQNGKVERSRRVDNEEFWTRYSFSVRSMRRRPRSETGSAYTTSSASRWPCMARRPPKSSIDCSRPSGSRSTPMTRRALPQDRRP